MHETTGLTLQQWLAWLGASVAAGISMVSFIFMNFPSAERVQKIEERVEHQTEKYVTREEFNLMLKQLDRMESKIDTLSPQHR